MASSKALSAVRMQVAATGLRPGGNVSVRRKYLAPGGALSAGFPSGNQIHFAPLNGFIFSSSSHPIHLPCQSLCSSSPMLHLAAALQSEAWPFLSQTLTFQKHCWRGINRLPAYSTFTELSDETLPLSHKSPRLFSRSFLLLATTT